MAKVLKRLGTLAHKFSIDITVHTLQMSLSVPVKINIVWKRRNKRIESTNKPELLPSIGSVELEETLTMINTLYQKKAGNYMEKKADLTVMAIIDGKGSKSIGGLHLNISDYQSAPLTRQTFKLEKSPDRYSSITVSIRCRSLGEPAPVTDNMSDASGDSGVSFGTEGDYNGPPLFEQDLSGFEEETKVLPGSQGRPPALIKSQKSGGDPPRGPEPRSTKRTEPQVQELQAQLSLLEREKASLHGEKTEIQTHYAALIESSKKDREKLMEHIKSLDAQIEEVSSLTDTYKSKLEFTEEDNRKLLQNKKELLSALKKQENALKDAQLTIEKLTTDNEKLSKTVEQTEDRLKSVQRKLSDSVCEQTKQDSALIQLQTENDSLRSTLEQLRKDLSEAPTDHPDAAFSTYKKQTEIVGKRVVSRGFEATGADCRIAQKRD